MSVVDDIRAYCIIEAENIVKRIFLIYYDNMKYERHSVITQNYCNIKINVFAEVYYGVGRR